MTDKSQAKSYLKQYFGTKRYLYQDGRKVAHMHVVNGVYLLHGHFKFVVNVNHNRVTMLVDRRDVKRNKECMR